MQFSRVRGDIYLACTQSGAHLADGARTTEDPIDLFGVAHVAQTVAPPRAGCRRARAERSAHAAQHRRQQLHNCAENERVSTQSRSAVRLRSQSVERSLFKQI